MLVYYPHRSLREVAKPVKDFGEPLCDVINNMREVLIQKEGLGISAPQVNESLRCFLVRDKGKIITFVNPEVLYKSMVREWFEEGCLSLPGVYLQIERPVSVEVRSQNMQGEFFSIKAEGLMARVLLHEIDHLDGTLFIDYFTQRFAEIFYWLRHFPQRPMRVVY